MIFHSIEAQAQPTHDYRATKQNHPFLFVGLNEDHAFWAGRLVGFFSGNKPVW